MTDTLKDVLDRMDAAQRREATYQLGARVLEILARWGPAGTAAEWRHSRSEMATDIVCAARSLSLLDSEVSP